MRMLLSGKCVVVTGSGKGIGRAAAIAMAREGARVVVNDVNREGADATVREIEQNGGKAVACYESVASMQGAEKIINTCVETFGKIDVLVNNAGILRDRMVFNMTEQEWDDVVAVHLTGFFNVVKPASIIMRQQRSGRIIGFSSGSGMNGNTGQANYGAAKAGITGGVRCAARDLGRYGVTSNAICPGANTRMTQSVPDAARDLRARAGIQGQQRQPSIVNQLRGPEMVAPMVAYLLTDQAWNINGKCFYVSGGSVSLAHDETPYRTIAKPGMWE